MYIVVFIAVRRLSAALPKKLPSLILGATFFSILNKSSAGNIMRIRFEFPLRIRHIRRRRRRHRNRSGFLDGEPYNTKSLYGNE
jgi:hypothetical protein